MNVSEAIRTLLAVRSYRPDPIPDQVLTKILEAGRLTASAMNRQPWGFVVVRDRETLNKLAELASTGPYIAEAPLAIAVVVPDKRFGLMDGARAAQDMMLAAWGEGVGSNWVGTPGSQPVGELLDVPEGQIVLTVIAFGYPRQQLGKGRKNRKPLSEVAHDGRFGRPYQG